jgi:hypothetical protein
MTLQFKLSWTTRRFEGCAGRSSVSWASRLLATLLQGSRTCVLRGIGSELLGERSAVRGGAALAFPGSGSTCG